MLPVAQLGGEEDFLASESTGGDRGSHACFIAVGGRRIDVPGAGLQRVLDDALRLPLRDLENAEAKLGNGDPVVQRQVWDDRHANSKYLRERDHSSLGVAGGLVEGQPVPDLPRTSRPTFGVEPGSGSGQNGVMGQSAEFGQFLRVMRARMRPEAAGLPTTTTPAVCPGCAVRRSRSLRGSAPTTTHAWNKDARSGPPRPLSTPSPAPCSSTSHSGRTCWICCTTARRHPSHPPRYSGSAPDCGSCWTPSATPRRWCWDAAPTCYPATVWRICSSPTSPTYRPVSAT